MHKPEYSNFIELYNDSNDTINLNDYWIETDNDHDRSTAWDDDYRYRKGFYMFDMKAHDSSDWIGAEGYRTMLVSPRSFAVVLPKLPNLTATQKGIFASIIPDNATVVRINQGTEWFHDPSIWSTIYASFNSPVGKNDNPNNGNSRIWLYDNFDATRNMCFRLVKKSGSVVTDEVHITGNNYWTTGADRCVSFGRPSLHQGWHGVSIGLTPNSIIVWYGIAEVPTGLQTMIPLSDLVRRVLQILDRLLPINFLLIPARLLPALLTGL